MKCELYSFSLILDKNIAYLITFTKNAAAVDTPLVVGVTSNQLQDCAANIQGAQDSILPQ